MRSRKCWLSTNNNKKFHNPIEKSNNNMPSFIHSTFSQPRSCSKNDWRIMQQNKFETRLGSKMFGRTQMEFRSCSGHVSNHQEWGQNPTGSLCICGISFGWILLCFYLHVLFLLYKRMVENVNFQNGEI